MELGNHASVVPVAVMQPYFFPYAGYFRLMHYCKIFVIYDCVQYTRRSWISRNKFIKKDLSLDWLNMPIAKASREIKIKDLAFRENSEFKLNDFRLINLLTRAEQDFLFEEKISPISLLCRQLQWVSERLSLECEIIRSSDLDIDEKFRGSDRVIEITKNIDGTEYVNLSGGINLYSSADFSANGIKLRILSPYEGSSINILDRITSESADSLIAEISNQTTFQDVD